MAFAISVVASSLAACAADTGPRHIVGPVFFGCDDGTLLTVRFDQDDNTARVNASGARQYILRLAGTETGYWYVSNGYSLRGDGRNARWQARGQPPTACRNRGPTQNPITD